MCVVEKECRTMKFDLDKWMPLFISVFLVLLALVLTHPFG